jgi:4-phytase / acid phosphatase
MIVCFSLVVLMPSCPQTGRKVAANGHGGDRLEMLVILSRHGVRSPTWTADRLNAYSALPWPNWSVPPGYLTSRGFELVKLFGRYDRAALAQMGLIAATGCVDAAQTYIWADTDQRTLESGRALAEGMFPDCPPAVHSLPAGEIDPRFHSASAGARSAQPPMAAAESEAKAEPRLDAQQNELLAEMENVLLGCSPKISCTPTHVPAARLLDDPPVTGREKGERSAGFKDHLSAASSFAEDFLLEYADGMPASQIGWGHVDEEQLRRYLQLHSDYFDLMHRTPALAGIEASNMLFHIVRTLEQGKERRPIAGALGPANSKVVILAGHDTNIAGVAALLGLHWTLDGRTDDTPPGMELSFELWQSKLGAWSVHIKAATQTLHQLRTMQILTLAAPPAQQGLTLEPGHDEMHGVAWEDFKRIADAATGNNAAPPVQAK